MPLVKTGNMKLNKEVLKMNIQKIIQIERETFFLLKIMYGLNNFTKRKFCISTQYGKFHKDEYDDRYLHYNM